jgi:hypothetical protein
MPKFKVYGEYTEAYEAIIEAPDENTAVQIFYQKGGGESIDGVGWDNISADEHDDEDEHPHYSHLDYDPDGGKIRW